MSPRTPDALRLDIIGAGPAFTDRPGAAGSAYLVRHGETAILLDLGQGAFPRLAGTIDPGALDAILVSHLHPDHFVDLVSLRHFLRWGPRAPRRVRVIGPGGLGDRIDALHAEPGFCAASLDVEELAPGSMEIGWMTIEVATVTHAGRSFGFRLSTVGGSGLVYTGDCGRAEDLDALIRPGDTLLAEVSFGPGPVPPNAAHLDGPAVGALATRTGIRRLLLTHLLMGFDEDATVASARGAYSGTVTIVRPGDAFTVD